MGNIRVIGPRASGKTTYLAALAYWPDKNKQEGKGVNFKVYPLNDETEELAENAQNIIQAGGKLTRTVINKDGIEGEEGGIHNLPFYSYQIEIKPTFAKQETILLAVRDYPGEIFEELDASSINPLHQDFIDECFMGDVNGCLILFSEWKPGTDKRYKRILDKFTNLMKLYGRDNDLRIAMGISKCERGELWPGRLEPDIDLFKRHFPNTTELLKERIHPNNLGFYAISTFGVLSFNDPRPNRIDELGTYGKHSVLRNPNKWRPYGMISPLYWLSTGKRMRYDT